MPAGLCAEDLERVENIVYARRRVKRGEALFNAGAQFSAVYAIRSGFFKTSVLDGDGREQVTGFFMGASSSVSTAWARATTTAPRWPSRTAKCACCRMP